jgi:NADH-quinone oxidoreductase subunit L
MVLQGHFYGEEYAEFWKGALFTGRDNELHEHSPRSGLGCAQPFIAMVVGFVTPGTCTSSRRSTPAVLAASIRCSTSSCLNKWYFDELYDFLFVRSAKASAASCGRRVTAASSTAYGPNGIAARVVDVTNRVVRLQTGYLYHYAFAMLIGIAALVTWMMLGSALR